MLSRVNDTIDNINKFINRDNSKKGYNIIIKNDVIVSHPKILDLVKKMSRIFDKWINPTYQTFNTRR